MEYFEQLVAAGDEMRAMLEAIADNILPAGESYQQVLDLMHTWDNAKKYWEAA